ncbi:hypothetical protein BGZ60DRAFT_395066 [Tricladium varicosporioides]|nr:hypothetical protein BGZ60DRAFT_395066 [Hymenoscyphus varicosporioides]
MSQTSTETIVAEVASVPLNADNYIHTTLNYWKEDSEILREGQGKAANLTEHELRIARRADNAPNINPVAVRIRNIRPTLSSYTIPIQGFQVCYLSSQMRNWHKDEELKSVYFDEVSKLLKNVTGAVHVHSYEHHVRQKTLAEALATSSESKVDINGPVRRVHIDETPRSARTERNYYLPWTKPSNSHLHDRPFGIYNIWKPLKTIKRDPLCFCDARSLKSEDLQPGAVTVPNVGEIENFSIKAPRRGEEGRHEWCFVDQQGETEAVVFKIFDSRDENVEGGLEKHGVAHTSFVVEGTEGVEARESVEVRSFCFF